MSIAKSLITKKIYFHLLLAELLIISLLVPITVYFNLNYELTISMALIGLGMMLAVALIYYFDVLVPFSGVLDQVKAVLTGRRYKKIVSNRTDEIGIFAHFFNEVTESLEKVTEELEQNKKISSELKTAGQLQKDLIPIFTPKIPGFDICVKNRSAEELGGDNMDFIKVNNSTLFYIGDVTGHGMSAAIVMTMVNTLINAFSEIYTSAYEIVVHTNRRLKMRIKTTMFMSMMMLKWDSSIKKMTYVGCGHEYLLVYRAKTGKCEATISGGIALGMIADNSKIVKEKDLNLDVGDVIVLYTDGVTEARNNKGEMFGLDRLVNAIEFYGANSDSTTLVQNVAKLFSEFVQEHVQDDDITLIAMRRMNDEYEGSSSVDRQQGKWGQNPAQS